MYKQAPRPSNEVAGPKGRFTRVIENFKCERCGTEVKGNGYTDHCPNCLTSKHVDVMPGDRSSPCKGLMDPISVDYKGGEFRINYECESCKEHKSVKSAPDDNQDLLIELSAAHV